MELLPGTRLGSYEIVGQLGAGGMGVVYRALDAHLNRPVAIKVLSDALADPAARRRFQREAQTASSLNHPHIVTVHDAGEFEGRQYLVTEFVEGGTLRDWAREAKRGWRQIVELLTGIADGLATAHEAGVLHRDIKPENILITKSGYAKLADFGLAKLRDDPTADQAPIVTDLRTRPGVIVGTPAYMSPEQAAGQPVDARSDIFSFGIVLYEALAGRRPFDGASDLDVMHGIVHRPAAPLSDDVPPQLRMIVEKAIEKDPADRFQSMRDLVVDLRRVARPSAVAPPALATIHPSTRARRWLATAAAFALVLAAVGALLVFQVRQPVEPASREYTQLTNFSDSAVAPALSPDGRILAFIRGEDTFVGRGEIYAKVLPDSEPVPITHDDRPKMGPLVFSPDGSRIAYSVGTEDTWTVPVLGGEPTHLIANAGGLSWIDAGTGQRRIMFSSRTTPVQGLHTGIYTATESRADERSVYVPTDVNGMAHRAFLSPDRKSVLTVEMDISSWLPCRLVPFDGRSAGTQVGPAPSLCTDAAWSPDGQWMYFSANIGNGYHIWRQRYPAGSPEQVTSGATEEQGIAFAPDGRSFVTSVGEKLSTVWVHEARGEKQITSQGYAFLPSFSSDGTRLYYLQRSRANRRFVSGELWAVGLATGKRERLLSDFLMEYYDVGADGSHVVFVSIDDAGHSPVWMASLDGRAPPRQLSSLYSVRALFGIHDDVFFAGGETKDALSLYHVNADGSGLAKVVPNHVLFLYDVSPDGQWVSAWEGNAVVMYSADGLSRRLLCGLCATAGEEYRGVTPPLVKWSRDGRYLYLHDTDSRQTYAVPLRPGQMLPPFPDEGFRSIADAALKLGGRAIPDQRAFPSSDPAIYAFPRSATHRNIYRIPVP